VSWVKRHMQVLLGAALALIQHMTVPLDP